MEPIPFKEPIFTFAEACEATGASEAWLRTFIQRDKTGTLGTKQRHGRLLFSLMDIGSIALLHTLNAHLKVSPAAAWEVRNSLETFILQHLAELDTYSSRTLCAGFDTDGTLLIWHVNSEGVLETFNDAADERMHETFIASRRAHIAIPITAIFDPVRSAQMIAEKWESE